METVKNSIICRKFAPLWIWLCGCWQTSACGGALRGFGALWARLCDGSRVMGFFGRDSILTRAWPESIFCRVLMFLLNLPVTILQLLYRALKVPFENSRIAAVIFAALADTPFAVGWLMLGIMVVPYEHWNNAYSLLGFAFLLCLAMAAGMRRNTHQIDLCAIGPWLFAFAAFTALAVPMSAYPSKSARFLIYHAACMLCMLVVVSSVEKREHLLRLLECSGLAMIVMSCYGFVQRIQGIEVNPSYVDLLVNENMPGRVFSFYENPNAFGEVLLMLLPLAVALILCSPGWGGRLIGLLSTAAGCAAIAMTYSRACWIGLVVAALVFVVLWKKSLLPLFFAAGLLGASFLPDTVFHRILTIFNTNDTSTSSRFPLYRAAGELLRLRPIEGAGLGTDAVRAAVKELNFFHGKDRFVHCHDIYLQIWCETGLPGILTFLGSMLWLFKKGLKTAALAHCPQSVRLPVIGGTAAIMGTLVCGIADYIWNYPRVMLIFWFVAAVTLAGVRLAAREPNGEA